MKLSGDCMLKVKDIYHPITEFYEANICCKHPNAFKCEFEIQDEKIKISPASLKVLESLKSLESFMLSNFPIGLSEKNIAYVVMKVLEALKWNHTHGKRVHGYIDSDNVFLDEEFNVKLGLPLWIIKQNSELTGKVEKLEKDDKVMVEKIEDGQKKDVAMVGILAVKLFYGPAGKKSCFFGKKLPSSLRKLVKNCLDGKSTSELIEHEFLKKYYKEDGQEDLKKKITRKQNKKYSFVCN